jgi:hypothetical protein
MFATLAAADEDRIRALVIVAAAPRWGDWFLVFWDLPEDRLDYLRAMRPLDPIEVVGRAAPAAMLFQFGRHDFYIAAMSGLDFHGAAPDGSELAAYDTGHDMRLPEIRRPARGPRAPRARRGLTRQRNRKLSMTASAAGRTALSVEPSTGSTAMTSNPSLASTTITRVVPCVSR